MANPQESKQGFREKFWFLLR